jgi:hypothetical protein
MGKSPEDKKIGAQLGSQSRPFVSTESVSAAADDEIVNLSFKVSSAFRKRFKLAAIHEGITQNELVQRALDAWESAHTKDE